jgi:hypothetical protein
MVAKQLVGSPFLYIVYEYIIHWQVRQIAFEVSFIVLSTWYVNILMYWPVGNVANSCLEGPGFDSRKIWDERFLCSDENRWTVENSKPLSRLGASIKSSFYCCIIRIFLTVDPASEINSSTLPRNWR